MLYGEGQEAEIFSTTDGKFKAITLLYPKPNIMFDIFIKAVIFCGIIEFSLTNNIQSFS